MDIDTLADALCPERIVRRELKATFERLARRSLLGIELEACFALHAQQDAARLLRVLDGLLYVLSTKENGWGVFTRSGAVERMKEQLAERPRRLPRDMVV